MENGSFTSSIQSQLKTALKATFLIGSVLFTSEVWAQAGSGGSSSGWGQRAQARESKRWTLQEWLAQKDRNKLMDQWLMMNSPSPFEFYLMGASNNYKSQKNLEAKESYSSASGGFGAYAQAVGLSGEYENNQKEHYSDVTGMLNIRLLGSSLQTTSITLSLGQRTRQYLENTTEETIRNNLGQVILQAYFTKYFGLTGTYRQYLPSDHSSLGEVSGTLVEGGLFIDFKGLRVFGVWSDDLQVNKAENGSKTEYKRQGIKSGLVIFF